MTVEDLVEWLRLPYAGSQWGGPNTAKMLQRRARVIAALYCVEPPATARELATSLGVTRERVHQIETLSLRVLRCYGVRAMVLETGKATPDSRFVRALESSY